MKGSWKPTNHTVGDFKDWKNDNKLVLQPTFQRNAVWNQTSRIMLIDTLIKEYPIPKVFIQNVTEDGRTVRKIIDGQQRISAILDYINDKFSLEDPYAGEYEGSKFSELPTEIQSSLLQFTIDCNEAFGYTDEQYREIYTRLNKYTIPLNKQELRKAEFPGAFYQLAEDIANLEILDNWKVFTLASRRRLLDVEFISEILAGLLEGPQDKKKTLDDFYRKYNKSDLSDLDKRIRLIINEIALLFPENTISKTRFRQKADFYSLCLAIDFFTQEKLSLKEKEIEYLREDFQYLDQNIEPYDENSGVTILNEYALRCIGSANSSASRKWRVNFLKLILSGTYYDNDNFFEHFERYKQNTYLNQFLEFYDLGDPIYHDSGFFPLGTTVCGLCNDDFELLNEINLETDEWLLIWIRKKPIQLSNLLIIHEKHFNPNEHLKFTTFIALDRDNENKRFRRIRQILSEETSESIPDEFIDDLFKGIDDD